MSNVNWKDFVPSSIVSQIQCGCFDYFSGDSLITAVCTKKQQLLEISQSSVISSCNIPFKDSENVSIFYSYDPDYKYYLVEADKSLCVIRKTEKLEVLKQYDNLEKLEVKDGFNCGFPQVHICLIDEFEPIITDFTDREFNDFFETKESVKAESEFAFSLNCNLQDMKLKLEQNKHRLKERRKMRTAALYKFTENVSNQEDPVSKFHPKRSANDGAGVIVTSTWQKLHHDKWIIGVDFKTTENEVSELELILDSAEYSSRLLLLNRDTTGGGFRWISHSHDPRPNHFQPATSLPPNSCAHFLAVQKKPCFIDSSSACITGVVSYQLKERKFQSVIPSTITLKTEDLLNDRLLPFAKDCEKVQNLLAIFVSSESIDLEIFLPYSLEIPLNDLLTQKLNFTSLPKLGYYFNSCSSNIGLCGMLAYLNFISPTNVYLLLFGKDCSQLILFLNCVNNYLPHGTSFSKYSPPSSAATVEDGLESLKSELKLIALATEKHVSGEYIKVPKSEWKILRENLHKQECKTDLILSKLSSFMEKK